VDSGMVSKIEKARRYAEEKDRVRFTQLDVSFRGDNSVHAVHFDQAGWKCGCRFFAQRGVCSHTMALERILVGMLPDSTPEVASTAPVSLQGDHSA